MVARQLPHGLRPSSTSSPNPPFPPQLRLMRTAPKKRCSCSLPHLLMTPHGSQASKEIGLTEVLGNKLARHASDDGVSFRTRHHLVRDKSEGTSEEPADPQHYSSFYPCSETFRGSGRLP